MKNDNKTPEDFVSNIKEAYIEARKKKVDNVHTHRGRSYTISGYSEDLLADYLEKNIQTRYEYYIDQAISYKKGEETKR